MRANRKKQEEAKRQADIAEQMLRNFNKKSNTLRGGAQGGQNASSDMGENLPSPTLKSMKTKRFSKGSIAIDSNMDADYLEDGGDVQDSLRGANRSKSPEIDHSAMEEFD